MCRSTGARRNLASVRKEEQFRVAGAWSARREWQDMGCQGRAQDCHLSSRKVEAVGVEHKAVRYSEAFYKDQTGCGVEMDGQGRINQRQGDPMQDCGSNLS